MSVWGAELTWLACVSSEGTLEGYACNPHGSCDVHCTIEIYHMCIVVAGTDSLYLVHSMRIWSVLHMCFICRQPWPDDMYCTVHDNLGSPADAACSFWSAELSLSCSRIHTWCWCRGSSESSLGLTCCVVSIVMLNSQSVSFMMLTLVCLEVSRLLLWSPQASRFLESG